MNPIHQAFDVPPHRYTGTVYGTLLNSKAALARLGDSVDAAPYKGAPKSPVLYLKPTNTLCRESDALLIPPGVPELEVGAALGIVIARTACNVSAEKAMEYVGGYTVVADLSVPHSKFYRPSLRYKAVDATCAVAQTVTPASQVESPDELAVRVQVDGQTVHSTSTSGMFRSVSQLLADVTEFMTLVPGDILMLGVAAGAPMVRSGQSLSIEIDGVGKLTKHVQGAQQ